MTKAEISRYVYSMKLEEQLVNVDLDVEKALKNIPQDDNNAYIYIRVCLEDRIKPELSGYISAEGSGPAMISAMVSAMIENKDLLKCVKKALKIIK